MLKGIDPLLGPELLQILAAMGPGTRSSLLMGTSRVSHMRFGWYGLTV